MMTALNAPGYLIAELTITDAKIFYEEYMALVVPVLKKFGARFLIATNEPQVIEGGRDVKRVIFVEFESLAVAREFYYSKDYQDIIESRLRSSSAHLYLLEGLPRP